VDTFDVAPLSSALGAEITGLDLSEPPSRAVAAQLDALLARHLVLVIRDQALDPATMVRVLAGLGPTMRQHYSRYLAPDCPDVGILSSADAERGPDGRRVQLGVSCWHSDHINHERPPKCTALHAVKLPSRGGDTSFANMRTAYRRLPAAMRERVERMRSVSGLDRDLVVVRDADRERHAVPSVHPLVRTHPVTGEPALYFHPGKLDHFEGMGREDSLAFIEALQEQVLVPDVIYRHRWRVGDLLLCDNRACVHRAHDDYDHEQGRVMYRLLIEGDRPYYRPATRLNFD
jgi:taurine dioxygenase